MDWGPDMDTGTGLGGEGSGTEGGNTGRGQVLFSAEPTL